MWAQCIGAGRYMDSGETLTILGNWVFIDLSQIETLYETASQVWRS